MESQLIWVFQENLWWKIEGNQKYPFVTPFHNENISYEIFENPICRLKNNRQNQDRFCNIISRA